MPYVDWIQIIALIRPGVSQCAVVVSPVQLVGMLAMPDGRTPVCTGCGRTTTIWGMCEYLSILVMLSHEFELEADTVIIRIQNIAFIVTVVTESGIELETAQSEVGRRAGQVQAIARIVTDVLFKRIIGHHIRTGDRILPIQAVRAGMLARYAEVVVFEDRIAKEGITLLIIGDTDVAFRTRISEIAAFTSRSTPVTASVAG